jgi:hypothetical protein
LDFLYLESEDIQRLSEEESTVLLIKVEKGATLEIPTAK